MKKKLMTLAIALVTIPSCVNAMLSGRLAPGQQPPHIYATSGRLKFQLAPRQQAPAVEQQQAQVAQPQPAAQPAQSSRRYGWATMLSGAMDRYIAEQRAAGVSEDEARRRLTEALSRHAPVQSQPAAQPQPSRRYGWATMLSQAMDRYIAEQQAAGVSPEEARRRLTESLSRQASERQAAEARAAARAEGRVVRNPAPRRAGGGALNK